MMDKIKSHLKKIPLHIWILVGIVLLGIFFRTYNFHDWLQFKGDAIRDAILVSHPVLEGPQSLPLLGPRAGGTTLHLGPIFYYFQYIAGFIFQSTSPVVFTYPDLLFSILTIPMAFLLLRMYFSSMLATVLSSMLTFSFFAIESGRYAWNPNATPFFTLVFCWALLNIYRSGNDTEEKNKLIWFAIAGGSLAIASQLHFSAFFGLPVIMILFVLLQAKRSREILSWKGCAIFFAVILVTYLPFIINELVTHGRESSQFFGVMEKKSVVYGIGQNLMRNIKLFSKYFLYISTGIASGSYWKYAASGIFFFLAAGANAFLFFKEKDKNKKRFLQLSLLFVIVYFIIYIPLAFKIDRSRFFLPLLAMPFIYVGYIAVTLQKFGFLRSAHFFAVVIAILAIFSNLNFTLSWFSDLDKSQKKSEVVPAGGGSFLWAWGHYEKAAAYMDKNCEKNSVFFIMSKRTREYADSIEYALKQENRRLLVKSHKNYERKEKDLDRCYYFVSLFGESLPDYASREKHDEPYLIGNMQISRWYPENATEPDVPNKEERETDSLQKKISSRSRLSWGDLFQQ